MVAKYRCRVACALLPSVFGPGGASLFGGVGALAPASFLWSPKCARTDATLWYVAPSGVGEQAHVLHGRLHNVHLRVSGPCCFAQFLQLYLILVSAAVGLLVKGMGVVHCLHSRWYGASSPSARIARGGTGSPLRPLSSSKVNITSGVALSCASRVRLGWKKTAECLSSFFLWLGRMSGWSACVSGVKCFRHVGCLLKSSSLTGTLSVPNAYL